MLSNYQESPPRTAHGPGIKFNLCTWLKAPCDAAPARFSDLIPYPSGSLADAASHHAERLPVPYTPDSAPTSAPRAPAWEAPHTAPSFFPLWSPLRYNFVSSVTASGVVP